MGSNPIEVLNFFSGFLHNCIINCIHSCDDHSSFDEKLLVNTVKNLFSILIKKNRLIIAHAGYTTKNRVRQLKAELVFHCILT